MNIIGDEPKPVVEILMVAWCDLRPSSNFSVEELMANASVETFADDQVIFRENVSRIEGNPGDMDWNSNTNKWIFHGRDGIHV